MRSFNDDKDDDDDDGDDTNVGNYWEDDNSVLGPVAPCLVCGTAVPLTKKSSLTCSKRCDFLLGLRQLVEQALAKPTPVPDTCELRPLAATETIDLVLARLAAAGISEDETRRWLAARLAAFYSR